MQIHNVRLGLATNSSSAHSLIFLKNVRDANVEEGQFGWNHFTAASRGAKLTYLGVLLRNALESNLIKSYSDRSHEIADTIVRDWIGQEIPKEAYVDHQSTYELPCEYNTKIPDRQFFEEFKAYLLQDDLVILGGSDNDDSTTDDSVNGHPLANGSDFKLPIPQEYPRMVCRKDGDCWVLFDRSGGAKVTFSFNDLKASPTKAITPQLVDIKCTSICSYGCPECYMGSTMVGNHAHTRDIIHVFSALGDLKVFEVALGGGEPTLHPDFIDILKSARNYGIVPNFTTKNMGWLRNPRKWTRILEYAGAFAYSVDKLSQIEDLAALLTVNGINKNRANLHLVMGMHDEYAFRRLLTSADDNGFRVTLLGYKTTGRGATYKPKNYDWWLKTVLDLQSKYKCPTLSIDTTLAAQYEKEILVADIPHVLFFTQEGKFSCYIDAVTKSMGASSYGDTTPLDFEYTSKVDLSDQIRAAFAKY